MIYVMRHGETEWNSERRMQGRMNSALTETGRAQAAVLGQLMEGVDLPIWCSPSGRAIQTAAIAFGGGQRPIQTDPRLMEIDVGAFSGRLLREVQEEQPELFEDDPMAWYDHAPGGEGFVGLETRVRSFLDDLSGDAIIVTHGMTLRMMRSWVLCGSDALFAEGERVGQGVVWCLDGTDCTRIEMLDGQRVQRAMR